MTRNNTLKGLAIATIFLSVLPALAYFAYYWKSVRNNSSIINQQELGLFMLIALTASVSHLAVGAAQSAVAIGGAFFMVSMFIHLIKIAALVLLYLSYKSTKSLSSVYLPTVKLKS
jgi:hypothetical protein